MKIEEFWQLIESADERSRGDMDRKCELVEAATSSLSSGSAAAFFSHFSESMNRAYTWELWGAAYVMNGGCSDDAFFDFRAALISRGRESFERAVRDPDSLALEVFDEEAWFYEGFQYAVHEGVEAAMAPEEPPVVARPEEPSGTPWEEDIGILKVKYPRLWEKFEHLWSATGESSPSRRRPWWKFW